LKSLPRGLRWFVPELVETLVCSILELRREAGGRLHADTGAADGDERKQDSGCQ
jgi:hypothetical protein